MTYGYIAVAVLGLIVVWTMPEPTGLGPMDRFADRLETRKEGRR